MTRSWAAPETKTRSAVDLGIDIVNGGPGNDDLVHGDYGYDRMYGGSGSGDIASFATDVGGGADRGVWASLRPTGPTAMATTSSLASRASKARPSRTP